MFMSILHNSLREFTESYDEEKMKYIDKLSNERGMVLNGWSFLGTDIPRAFQEFSDFIKTYTEHVIKDKKEINKENITERLKKNMQEDLLKESQIKYSSVPSIIETYVESVTNMIELVDESKKKLFEHHVDHDTIGYLSECTEIFMEGLNQSFNTMMSRVLRASGYYTDNVLLKNKGKKKKITFL